MTFSASGSTVVQNLQPGAQHANRGDGVAGERRCDWGQRGAVLARGLAGVTVMAASGRRLLSSSATCYEQPKRLVGRFQRR